MRSAEVLLHPLAPPKPGVGAPCNGCGVCCALELCPLGVLRHGRIRGPCPQLRWVDAQERYVCAMLAVDGVAQGRLRWGQALVRRWIAAGRGCDCDVNVHRPHAPLPPHDASGGDSPSSHTA